MIKRSIWFNGLIALMVVLISGILFRGYRLWSTNDFLFKEHFQLEDLQMPEWYPLATLGLGLVALIGIILVYFYRKIGVYLTIASLFISIAMQPEFMPDGTLYSMFTLFVFIGYGLSVVIPHWKEFK
ncbi:hypothetical protein [Moheibacter sediminis]|uniref:DoxX-like family protein n=1 Tax=Moheibacter sediminis TaxID=1434700 RepID=A0A1W2AE13_9FLAO|nr:hypothetical protein [Moheibacter sediminis]SMC58935.1 hypothetical protein SAMN06296427_10494 [Moheibacter sediminis]